MEEQEKVSHNSIPKEHGHTASGEDRKRESGKFVKGKGTHERGRQKGMVSAFVQGKGQNAALKWLMESKTPVCVYLISGVKFEGVIGSFDAFTICVNDVKKHQQIIYKDKISTINVANPKKPESGSYSYGQYGKRAPDTSKDHRE